MKKTMDVPGKIVYKDKSVVESTIRIRVYKKKGELYPNFGLMQTGVQAIVNGEKVRIKPKSVERVMFTFNNKEHILHSIGFGMYTHFVRVIVDGRLKMFSHIVSSGGTPGWFSSTPGQVAPTYTAGTPGGSHGNIYVGFAFSKEALGVANLIWCKPLLKLIRDCTELAARVENKEFKFEDPEEIVRIYNSSCAK